MSIRVYVGNLEPSTTEDVLGKAFANGGTRPKSVLIVRNPADDRSRGFGYVEVASEEEAEATARAMDGVVVDGQPLEVSATRPEATRQPGRDVRGRTRTGRVPGPRGREGAGRRSR